MREIYVILAFKVNHLVFYPLGKNEAFGCPVGERVCALFHLLFG